MDERTLFDQFHGALEMEPRPGAYDRMRFAMTNQPVVLKRRPALQLRWSKMGLRITAAFAAGLIVIAVVAAFLASHHGQVGSVPASQDPNVKAYQAMIRLDYNTMVSSTSNHCNTIQDTGCQAALNVILPTLQRWVADLKSFRTPSRFAIVDGQLRRHLSEVIAEMAAAEAFQNANDPNGFYAAMDALVYERAWIDPTTFALEGSYPRVAGTYHDAIGLARQSLNACVKGTPGPGDLACGALVSGQACRSDAAPNCETAVQSAATQLQTFLIALMQNPAPSAVATRDAKLQGDLIAADTNLLAITDALLKSDGAKAEAGRSAYGGAITSAAADVSAIGNP
jgi:hypothetical protein